MNRHQKQLASGSTAKAKIEAHIEKWENRCYSEGIPEVAPRQLEAQGLVPTYRALCAAIMKNDVHLTGLGYARPKTDAYMHLKRNEINARNGTPELF